MAKTRKFARSVWCFPAIILLSLCLLTIFRISGTSIGHFYTLLYGNTAEDSSLLVGEPRKIRSDEWGLNTPLALSQIQEGFPAFSPTTGQGQDVTLTFDVPYKEWSILFKPQNWSFFVLPVEFAFAFKWWFIAAALLLGAYYLVVTLLPRRFRIASLLSLCLFFSPFIHWWYQSGTLFSLACSLFVITLVVRLLQADNKRRNIVFLLLGLTYALTCLAFVLYIPFIAPLAMVMGAFLIGHMINELRNWTNRKSYLKRLSLLTIPVLICGSLTLTFLHAHSPVLEAISSSVYPGDRTEPSGGYDVLQLMGGYFNLQLQDDTKAASYSLNQSEASNFILIFPFLLPFFVYLFVKRKQLKVSIDWRVVLLLSLFLLLLIRLFVPASEFLFNILQLNRIPHNRILIGIGLLNFLLMLIAIQQLYKSKFVLPRALIYGSAILAFIVVLALGISLKLRFIGYIESPIKIIAIALLFALVMWLLLARRLTLAIGILALFSFISIANINPLYHGLGILTDSKLSSTLRSVDDKKGKWVVGDFAASFETLTAANGIDALSGIYAYPQLGLWDDIAKDKASENVYNRYAHVFFSVEPLTKPAQGQGAYFDPPALDAFRVHVDPCGEFLKAQNVRYVLQTNELTGSCVKKVTTIPYPAITFRIYELLR